MKAALMSSVCALGISFALVGCERKPSERGQPGGGTPSTAEQPPAQGPSAEQQPTEQQKAEQQRKEAEKKSIGGGPGATAQPMTALASIAAARCDREVKCNQVGPDKKYKTRTDCIAAMMKDKKDDFSVNSCAAVDQKKLGDCVQEIHNERCGSPIDWFNRVELCRSSKLCEK
jgi:hypothetical protein